MDFVGMILETQTDFEYIQAGVQVLQKFGVAYEVIVASAYRNPERTQEIITQAEKRGLQVWIGVSEMVGLCHFLCSRSEKPVLSVGLEQRAKTPPSQPVLYFGNTQESVIQSVYCAMQIMALKNKELAGKLLEDRIMRQKKVELDSNLLQKG